MHIRSYWTSRKQPVPALGFIIALALLVLAPPAEAQEFGGGPMSLFITYQCEPENKAAFRAHMAGPGVEQFERWKQEGVYSDYLVLFSNYVNTGDTAPDMLVRLDFDQYALSEKWMEVERTMPAGMTNEALRLCPPVTSYLADLEFRGEPSPQRDLTKAKYVWIPYHLNHGVGKPTYRKYFASYVQPQVEGWLEAGALSWWGVYLNQHNTGRPWDIIFLFEYSDINGLAQRNVVKEQVRAVLRKDPVWKEVSDNKQSYRVEDQVIIMDPILPKAGR